MDIKEAQEFIRSGEPLYAANAVVKNAIRDGYILCKVDEAVENIKRYSKTLGTRYSNVEQDVISTQEAIDVIKEACE